MLLSILDDKTFMVGVKTYKVGEELKLAEMTAPVVFPWGETSIVNLNEHLTEVSKRLRETRMSLSTRLHEVEEDFDEVAARLSLDYESFERDWLYYSDIFYKAIQDHIGGQLPLIRDPATGNITIRAKQPQETLNYLRDVCAQRVRFHNYESMRHLALHLTGGKKSEVAIESEIHINAQVPVVSANYMGPESATKYRPLIQWLEEAVVATYDEVTRYGPVAGIVWASSNKPNEPLYGRAYFLNAGSLLRQGQGDPKLALTTAIQRCQGKLPKPFAMGFFIYGNMPIVDEKARGVLLSTLQGEDAYYKILTVDTSQKLKVVKEGSDTTQLTVAQEGEESKLDKAIIDIAKAVMREPEIVPEEDTPAEEPAKEEKIEKASTTEVIGIGVGNVEGIKTMKLKRPEEPAAEEPPAEEPPKEE